METFARNLGVKVIHVDASADFLGALTGVNDPEAKRKIIGRLFVEVFQRESAKLASTLAPYSRRCGKQSRSRRKSRSRYGPQVEWPSTELHSMQPVVDAPAWQEAVQTTVLLTVGTAEI